MIYTSKQAEDAGILSTANRMCVAARTAPKAKGQDTIYTAILTGEDLQKLADKMVELADRDNLMFLKRDAGNVLNSGAVVLIGAKPRYAGLNCKMCGLLSCQAAQDLGATCIFVGIDMGIAIGSAASIAADDRVDNRIMFSIGKAAMEMGIFEEGIILHGIPISVSGKSVFFDRK